MAGLLPYFALSMPVLVYAFILLDELLQVQYEQHRAAWEADGKPAGFFWQPAECEGASMFAWSSLGQSLMFRTPAWIAVSPRLVSILRRYRWITWGWAIVWAVIFIGTWIEQGAFQG